MCHLLECASAHLLLWIWGTIGARTSLNGSEKLRCITVEELMACPDFTTKQFFLAQWAASLSILTVLSSHILGDTRLAV